MARKAGERATAAEGWLALAILLACLAVGWRILGARLEPPDQTLVVVPVGLPSDALLRYLTKQLAGEHAIQLWPAMAPPGVAWDDARRQYDAERFLQALESIPLEPGQRLLAVADENAGTAELTIVFGLAEQSGRRAVIFTKRLTAGVRERQWRHRVLTTARHELGHLAGLRHCASGSCAMHFSHSAADTDAKGPGFCEYCQRVWDAAGD